MSSKSKITSAGSVSPFASFIVARLAGRRTKIAEIENAVLEVIKPVGGWRDSKKLTIKANSNLLKASAFHLIEKRQVNWAGGNRVEDELNHFFAVFLVEDYVALYVSDSDLKSTVHEALMLDEIPSLKPVDEAVLINAYINGKSLRTLWLGGIHRNVSVKPNSKVLSGESLGDAIDTFGDNTFIAGAVRSNIAGVSLKRSGVWFGPKKNWSDFSDAAYGLLTTLNASDQQKPKSTSVHSGLASSAPDFSRVGRAYLIEWADPETIKGRTKGKRIVELRDTYEMNLTSTQPLAKDVQVEVTATATGTSQVFDLALGMKNRKVTFKASPRQVSSEFIDWIAGVEHDAEVMRLLYDCGHSVVCATLCLPAVVHRKFGIEFLDFAPLGFNYNVKMEKPPGAPPPLDNIYDLNDVSLFKWVAKEGLGLMKLEQPTPGCCWLYCDDRSKEVADFIHVYKPASGTPKVSIIHVKGANNDSLTRLISPGAYELVTAQAIKNLKRISAGSIVDSIKSVLIASTNRVWDEAWRVGLRSNGSVKTDFYNALSGIKQDCDYQVVIVQPHALKSKFNPTGTPTIGELQLHTLLLGAEALAHSVSAEFRVISDNR